MSNYGFSWGNDEPGWDSEYDSTWEDDDEYYKLPKQFKPKRSQQHSRGSRAAKDLQRYRHGYPEPKLNLKFYRNEIPFEPYGVFIDDLHNYWRFDYYELESNHSYIQWLFPLREPGMNRSAIPLTEKEIEEMKKDDTVMQRLLESYKLMLGFYGIELVDPKTGEVARACNWFERFDNLDTNTHNNLRITRILKCLGELGYEHYQVPLVKFFLKETLCHGNLSNVKTSALNYFMFTVKNKSERRELVLFAWEHYEPKEKFTWGPLKTLRKLKPPAPVEKPDNESESMDAECENNTFQNNGRDPISSNRKEKTKSKKFPSEPDSLGKESQSQRCKNSEDYKESTDSPTVSDSGNDKDKESLIESTSEGDKEKEDTPKVSEPKEDRKNDDSHVESESEDKRKDGAPMRSGLNEDIEKSGSPTEFGSEDKNGEQPMQSGAENDKDNKGPATESESLDRKEEKGASMDSMSDNAKENRKTPTVSDSENEKVNKESPVGSKSVGDEENEETHTESKSREDNENGGSQVKSESEDKRKDGAPMRSGLNDDIESGSSTEFGSEDKNGDQPMQSVAANDKDNKGPATESESIDSKEKKGAPMDSISDDKENKKPPTDLGSEDNQENGAQSMQSGAVDDKSNTLPPTYEPEVDKENKETPRGSEEEKNGEQPMLSGSADDKNSVPPNECDTGNVIGVNRESQGLPTDSV
ncbi:uncharacterized protein LOC143936035 [Lithobates pipiens]